MFLSGVVEHSTLSPVKDAAPMQLGCSLRTQVPARSLEAGIRLMPALGISRLTDITRMDRLGLPVCVSVRPRGKTLHVHAGKAMELLDARVGALFEAIEFSAAEPQRSTWHVQTKPVGELLAHWKGRFSWVDLAPVLAAATSTRTKVDVIKCEELVQGHALLVPAELVFVPWEPRKGTRAIFGYSTNGLASGNSLEDATLHALLEVMERDAIAMNLPRDASEWIAPAQLPMRFGELAATWRELGVELAVRHVPNIFQLPCYRACLYGKDDTGVHLAAGHGLHLSNGIALARAVCEAAQSRLVQIHGGRDDIVGHYGTVAALDPPARLEAFESEASRWFDPARSTSFDAVTSWLSPTRPIGKLVEALIHRLAQLGFGAVLRHRFQLDLQGLHVVRILVPGLEHVRGGSTRIGPRMLRKVVDHGPG